MRVPARHSSDAGVDALHASPRWHAIEVRHLIALATVAREGSFRRAAEELGYVQSAISSQIAHLEQAAGMRLLERASGAPHVELTDAGRVLLRHVDEILARFDTAYANVGSLSLRTMDTVRVAGLEHFAPLRVASVLSLFRKRHPFVRVVIQEVAMTVAAAELRGGSLDVLVWEPPEVPDSLAQVVVESGEYVLLVPAASELAGRREPLKANDLSAARPIVPSSRVASAGLLAQLDRLEVAPHPSLVPDSVSIAQALVAAGVGSAILPSALIDQQDPRTVCLDLSHLLAPRTIAVAMDGERAQSTAVNAFVGALRDACESDLRDPCEADQMAGDDTVVRRRAAAA